MIHNRVDLETAVLAHCVTFKETLARALTLGLTADHFILVEGEVINYRAQLFRYIARYFAESGSLLTYSHLEHNLATAEGIADAHRREMLFLWQQMQTIPVDANDSAYLLVELRKARAVKLLEEFHLSAAAVLTTGGGIAEWIDKARASLDKIEGETRDSTSAAIEWLDGTDLLALAEGGLKWLVEDVLLEGGLTYLVSPSGYAKTWVAMALAVTAATGGEWMGVDVPQVPVMYLDLEMGRKPFGCRYAALGGIGGDCLTYADTSIDVQNASHMTALHNRIVEKGVRLVVVDTLSRAHSGDENASQQMRAVYTVLKQLKDKTGVSMLISHHCRKPKENENGLSADMVRGSSDIIAQADNVYLISKESGVNRLTTCKSRYTSEEAALDVYFEVTDANGIVKLETVPGPEARGSALTVKDAIRRALAGGQHLTIRELVHITHQRSQDLRDVAKLMLDEVLITCVPGHATTYSLTPVGEEEAW